MFTTQAGNTPATLGEAAGEVEIPEELEAILELILQALRDKARQLTHH